MVEHLFRSLMFVPAHNERLMKSAARSNADVLLFDIEDSVQPRSNKQIARDCILKYISSGDFNGRPVYSRVNDRESGELLRDIYQLTVPGIEGFMYPKATNGDDVYFVGKLLETIEYEKGIPVGIRQLAS
jgi:citrate lyase subunit beta/citryl-CoA lyase